MHSRGRGFSALDTHMPLPGVTVGDIGPKVRVFLVRLSFCSFVVLFVWLPCPRRRRALTSHMLESDTRQFAFNTVDNGFLRLTHVRIPR